ncbi:hypothetical protein ACU8DI_07950 [Psychroserpens sp. BH13MA-6]
MKNQIETHICGHDLIIGYNTPETDLNQINETNCGQLIWVLLKPKQKFTERQGIEVFELAESKLLNEIKSIVSDNIEFYKNFKIEYTFNRRSCSLYKEFSNTFISSMQVYLKIEMKK